MKLSLEQFGKLTSLKKHEYVKTFQRGRAQKPSVLVYGHGIVDTKYPVRPLLEGGRIIDPAYQCWSGMLERVFSEKFHSKNRTYIGVGLCDSWFSLREFTRWWEVNQIDGWHLDKDLLGVSRTYSPDSCLFVPAWLNNLTASHRSGRGDCPIGVSKFRDSFQAKVCVDGATVWLGCFGTELEAHQAWKSRKLEIALSKKQSMDDIDDRIYTRVVEIIEGAS